MRRTWWAVFLAMVTIALTPSGLSACGDKFLRVGRSARFRGYASVHPSSILVFAPHWTSRGVADFERMLTRGGHKAMTVTSNAALTQAIAAAHYDVVISHYSDTAFVRQELDALRSKPAVLPLLYKPTKIQAAEAAAAYKHVLRVEKMTPFDALEEIDRLLEHVEPAPAAVAR